MAAILRNPRVRFIVGFAVAAGVLIGMNQWNVWKARIRYPSKWDPRIEKLAAETELLRGLTFKHKVAVVGVANETFDRNDKQDPAVWQPDTGANAVYSCSRTFGSTTYPPCSYNNGVGGEDIDIAASVARALHLAPPDAKLPDMPLSVEGAGVVARYLPTTKRIEIRGSLDAIPKAVIVHELTHALQDQHFSVTYQGSPSLDESLAYRALVEGDAVRIEDAYRARHDADAHEAALEEALSTDAFIRTNQAIATDTSEAIEADLRLGIAGFPYVEGAAYVKALAHRGGQKLVDAKFLKPPTTTAEIMRLGRVSQSLPLAFVDFIAGSRFNQGSTALGALYWSIVFEHHDLWAERTAFVKAIAAEDFVVYYESSRDRVCFSSFLRFAGPNEIQGTAAVRTLAKRIGVDARTREHGVEIHACDTADHGRALDPVDGSPAYGITADTYGADNSKLDPASDESMCDMYDEAVRNQVVFSVPESCNGG